MTAAPIQTKNFDPRALASITTGTLLLQDFGQVHEAIEHVLGHPVWTHELPDLADAATELIIKQYPDLPVGEPADWHTLSEGLLSRYGTAVPVERGNTERTVGPLTTLEAKLGQRS